MTGARPVGGVLAISAAIVGNALEWFDFTVYGLFSIYIAKAFFPSGDELSALLLTLATYGVGFVLRPVGAIVLGQYADQHGRRAALTLIILLMLLGSAMIAFAPTYAQVGAAAPALIVAARLVQGFSVGGEMGGATAYLIETAPPHRRGFYASWQYAGQAGASLGGSLFAFALTHLLTQGQLNDWGWRIPFLFGLSIGPVGLYLRSRVPESPVFTATPRSLSRPLSELWMNQRRVLFQAFALTIQLTACTYLIVIYMPTYAVHMLRCLGRIYRVEHRKLSLSCLKSHGRAFVRYDRSSEPASGIVARAGGHGLSSLSVFDRLSDLTGTGRRARGNGRAAGHVYRPVGLADWRAVSAINPIDRPIAQL